MTNVRDERADDEVRALLVRYQCPLPFHVVRTRLLGRIASLSPTVTPVESVADLWGGELPTFDDPDAANAFLGTLVMGLWNRLTAHQEAEAPFHFVRVTVSSSREDLARLAQIRAEEIEGFVEGMFAKAEHLDLPERAHRAFKAIGEARAILVGLRELLADPEKSATPNDVKHFLRNVQQMSRVCEAEIHAAVMDCARVRRMMAGLTP